MNPAKAPEKASVLDAMTAGIMGRKTERAATLTPVGMERTLGTTSAPFPNDHPAEAVQQAVREIRRQVTHIMQALAAVEAELGVAPPGPDEAVLVKEAEQAADEKFADRMARLQEDAQAATFAPTERLDADGQETLDPEGWECPEHGLDSIITIEGKRRTFKRCTQCKEFER